MKLSFAAIALSVLVSSAAKAESTFLAQKSIPMQSTRSNELLDRTLADLRMVFQRFQFALDSSTTIVVPKKVTGTAERPVMTVTVKKCILFICETMVLDAEVSAREVSGSCTRNFQIHSNLGRSDHKVRDIYDSLDVSVCFKEGREGRNTLTFVGHAHHGPGYRQDFVQQELVKMLQLQVEPLVKAVQDTLRAKE